jgi:hypothetical protein
MNMTQHYKFKHADLAKEIKDLEPKFNGRTALEVFAENTLKIVKKGAQLRYGVYWFAMKQVLRDHTKADLSAYDVSYLQAEYSKAIADDGTDVTMPPEMILFAGWKFDELTDNAFDPRTDWEIDGVTWDVRDED